MSRIDELIKRYAGGGVEYKALGDVVKIKTGPNINKEVIADNPGVYPVINSGRDPLGYVDMFNTEDDPIGIASRGSVGLVTWTPGRYFRGNLNYSCTVRDPASLTARFLYHYLLSADDGIQALATHQGIPALNAGNLKLLRVPVPPVEVQREIVRILDAFTELEAELEAELKGRRQQYAHYRDTLLTFSEDGDVKWLPLADVIEDLRTGLNPRQNFKLNPPGATNLYVTVRELSGFGISPSDKTDRVDDEGLARIQARSRLKVGDVLFSGTGTIGRTALVAEEPVDWNIKEGVYALTPLHDLVTPRFLIHLLHSGSIRGKVLASADGSTVASVSMASLRRVPVPVPPLDKQRRIVAVLDKFDALVNDLSSGLPAEIEARRQQYAYYRDRLLSFEEAAE